MKNFFHVIRSKNKTVLFHSGNFQGVCVSSLVGKIFKSLQQGKKKEDIQKNFKMSASVRVQVQKKLQEMERKISSLKIPFQKEVQRPITLYLNVSQNCNLRCLYCYANFGCYQSKAQIGQMSFETAQKAIQNFYENGFTLGNIVFFGGEPLLAFSLMQKVCEFVQKETLKRKVHPPGFSVVTNGVLINDQVSSFLVENKFGITISLDGPIEIHDLLRPKVNQEGSFQSVVKGIRLLQSKGMNPNIECTYTLQHLEKKISVPEVLKFFRDELGTRNITLAPVNAKNHKEIDLTPFMDQVIKEFRNGVRFSLESLFTEKPILLIYVEQILKPILSKTKKPLNLFCLTYLGKSNFVVSTQGGIYPCHMMNDHPSYHMGQVQDPFFSSSQTFQKIQNQIYKMNKEKLICKNCWAKHFCFLCLAGVEMETGDIKKFSETRCNWIRGMAEEILLFLYTKKSSQKAWKNFWLNFKNIHTPPNR